MAPVVRLLVLFGMRRWPIARTKKPHPHEATFASWRGAIVSIDFHDGIPMFRPAAHVFGTPSGFAWVEPSYADPYGAASPAFHKREGVLVPSDPAFTMACTDGLDIVLTQFDPRAHAGHGDPLIWFTRWIESEGRTWLEERERVRERIRRELE